jgi:hypothetical protein
MRVQMINKKPTPFYNSTKWSTWVMATGDTGFTPFQGLEAAALRNYNIGQNIFTQNAGRILAIKAEIFGASWAKFMYNEAGGLTAGANAVESLRNSGLITITQNSKTVHEDSLNNLIQRTPDFAIGAVEMVGIANYADGSQEVKRSNKNGFYFTPPLIVTPGTNVSFNVSTKAAILAALNTAYCRFQLATEEIAPDTLSEVRS